MRERQEIDGGIISKGSDTGKPNYFLTAFCDDGEMIISDYPSYAEAITDGRQAAIEWEFLLIDRTPHRMI